MIIIHGDDIPNIIKKRDELASSHSWLNTINIQKDNIETITNVFLENALFTKERTVVIENVQSIKGKESKKVIEIIKTNKDVTGITLILFATDVLPDTFLKNFKGAKVHVFRLPKYYFDFLDNLSPRRASFEINLLSKLSSTVTPEQIYYSMIKRIRLLLLLNLKSHNEFEDIKQLSPWQLTRLEKQSHMWTREQLIVFYKKLFELEVGMKTSSLQLSLLKHIDILLAQELH